jgi:hypothetical protein
VFIGDAVGCHFSSYPEDPESTQELRPDRNLMEDISMDE